MHAGAIVIAMGTVAWGPYLQSADKYPHSVLLTTITKRVVPRYQEWITESAFHLNSIVVMMIISISVCFLTAFGLTGGDFPFLYYALVAAMVVGNFLVTFSVETISIRLRKMVAAHNLLENAVGILNTQDEEEYTEEELDDVAEFINIVTDRETWDVLTTDNKDITIT
jgi:hypothetical protein